MRPERLQWSVEGWGGSVDGSVFAGRRELAAREGLLLTIRADDGTTGTGEASPLPGYSPDDVLTSRAVLDAVLPGVAERAELPGSIEGLRALLTDFERDLDRSPGARFALETALLDAAARAAGLPMHRLLRDDPPRAVALQGFVGDALDPELFARADALVRRGIKALKVKLGRRGDGFEREREAIRALREAVPREVELRLDANGRWSVDEARRHLAALAPYGVALVEQPVAVADTLALGRCAIPWAADEAIADRTTADALLVDPTAGEGCAAIVLKPTVLGGFARCLELARRATERGLGVIVTHCFEGPVALAAACELALAITGVWASGLAPHAGLTAFPPCEVPQLDGSAWARPGDYAGHGVLAAEGER